MKRRQATRHQNFLLCPKQRNNHRKEIKRAADPYWKANWQRSNKYYDQKTKSRAKIQRLELSRAFASAPERKLYLEPFQLGGLAQNTEIDNPRVDMDM
jgi:hypothetical protein